MKSFFKMVLATFVGVILAGIIGFFLLFIALGVMMSAALSSGSSETVMVKPNTIYRIMLDRPITERSQSGISNNLFSFSMETTIGLNDVLKTIDKASTDPNISLIFMDLSTLEIGMAHIEEVRNALLTFKESGKPIIAYGDNLSQGAYYLATVADKIYLNPYGSASLTGLSAEVMFYKNLLEKLGIEMQVIRHGKFKSAVEPFMLDKMSNENREQYMTFINSIWGHWLNEICLARQFNVEKLNKLIDNLELESAQQALETGLVDELLYKDELLSRLMNLVNVSSENKLAMVDVEDYARAPKKKEKLSRDKIAVVYADGEITMGKGEDGITAWNMANTLRNIRNDKSIKAVVFRVNSPGGSAQASEIIARELALIKEQKPVVVSMGNYAASGGYWISVPATKILANPTTLTGSIGVFGVIPNVKKGMNNHLGITTDVAKSNESSDYPSIMRPLTSREQQAIQTGVELIYSQFIEKVAIGRQMEKQAVDDIGQGRVWSGVDALKLGLIDEFGGITEAIETAAYLAGLDNYRTVELPTIRSPFEQLLESLMKGEVSIKAQMPEEIKTLEQFYKEVKEPGVYARMPFDVNVR